MSGGIRGPLRLLAGTLAAGALLVFLQTFVLRAAPYDSPWFGALSAFFRASFIVADVATIVALLVLGRRVPSVYPFTSLGTVILGLTVLCATGGWLLSTSALGAIEPMFTFGATVLLAFSLAAVLGPTPAPDRRRKIGYAVALALATVVLVMRIGSSISREPASMFIAWLRWALAVGQPAALAVVALLVSRAKEVGGPSSDVIAASAAAAAAGGGYRAAGEGALAVARPELAAPSPATIDPLRIASSGVALHRTAFLARVFVGAALLVISVIAAAPFAALLPFVGVATAIIIAIGVSRQRVLATFGAGTSMLAALVCFIASAVAEVGSVLWMAGKFLFRMHEQAGLLAFPAATLFTGLGILFVSRAHERAGDLLYRYRFAALARWTQALLVLSVTGVLATLAASWRDDPRSLHGKLGLLFVMTLGLLTTGTIVAVAVFHIKTLNEASRVLKDRLDKATDAGSHPNP